MKLIIEPRIQNIGFDVKRLLPSRHQQRVGPFIFFDHMGPATFTVEKTDNDVRPHPHIGLATVTYLFSGAMIHRDSLGSVQRIEPGAINLMTAGQGVVHSERIPADIRRSGTGVEGIQTWLALPLEQEECAPDFAHYDASQLPVISAEGYRLKVLIGSAKGERSPVVTASTTVYLDLQMETGGEFSVDIAAQELALYLVSGDLLVNTQLLTPGQLVILDQGDLLFSDRGAQAMLLGGDRLAGERFIFWNFVASSKASLAAAAERWERDEFPPVPGESERIPLPKKVI